MLRSVLVPLDGSSTGEWCLPLATRVARSMGARLHLAHVHVPYESDELLTHSAFKRGDLDPRDAHEDEAEREATYLRRWEDRLAEAGMAVESVVIDGTPIADELAGYAADVAADLIVMSSRGRSWLARALLGSVSDEMIRKSPAPLLVIHPDRKDRVVGSPTTVDHILVALDGSPLAECVLDAVLALASATGARMTLLHVVPDPSYLGPRITGLRPDRFEPDLDGAVDYLEGVAEGLRLGGLDVESLVVHGDDPVSAISRVADAQEADVIAVTTHGLGGVRRAVLGSVTDGLLRKTNRPLLVARAPRDAPAGETS